MSRPAPLVLAAGALVAAAAVAVLLGAGVGADKGRLVRAEFSTARGLLKANDVRIGGAPAGTVERIELTPRNTALVTMRLHDGLPPIRRDAVAVIRPVDLLGDVYVSLSPGRSQQPLQGTIPVAQTSNDPRLSDLLAAFPQRSRRGLQAILVSLGVALDRRGEDLNRAIVTLRPALQATDAVMRELGSQRASLRTLIRDAERMTRQLAAHGRGLGGSVEGLAGTLRATAARAPELDRGLATLPATLARLRGTATNLGATARSALPLARGLRSAAPPLAQVSARLSPFLRSAGPAIDDARPLVQELGAVLDAGEPTLPRLATGLRGLADAGPPLQRLMPAVERAAEPISQGFFVDFADQAAEPGTQPFDPNADPARHYWRGAAVFTCEAFGVKIAPHCLDQYLQSGQPGASRRARRHRAQRSRAQAPASRSAPAARAPAPTPRPVAGPVRSTLEQLGSGTPADTPVRRVLDYLLGP